MSVSGCRESFRLSQTKDRQIAKILTLLEDPARALFSCIAGAATIARDW